MDFYRAILRPLLFSGLKTDPEWLHQQTFQILNWLDVQTADPWRSWLVGQLDRTYGWHPDGWHPDRSSSPLQTPNLAQSIWGCHFSNPLGLAAGFDKDGLAAGLWGSFGFGFAELGTVTLHGQPGNPQPRLFRLLADQAVLNRMGFNNQGAAVLADRLAHHPHLQTAPRSFPLGINLGKSKITPLEEAADDYLGSFRLLKPYGQYFVVNVSSPNTPGLRSLQSVDQLEPIFQALQEENQQEKPLLVKIAPDLLDEDILAVVELAQRYHLAGMIATNTTIRREGLKTQTLEATGQPIAQEAGGISGVPVRQRSTDVIRLIHRHTQGQLPIIGVGGVFTAEDAWEKITAGASLIQTYTGWIYEGPGMVQRILQGLEQRLQENHLTAISQAIGLNA
ncbi:MAG: quinone-dependent dihydroorotate dehydrogenase [Synechococcales bacterium]|nr:quinone-dependent dihydroorotate dehydrogenase [Synechococcales bacterium]